MSWFDKKYFIKVGDQYVIENPEYAKYRGFSSFLGGKENAFECKFHNMLKAKFDLMEGGCDENLISFEERNST